MKAICFHCRFVGIGFQAARCPSCGYPLIMNLGGVALGSRELEHVFEVQQHADPARTPLPGVSEEKRQYQMLMERRRKRWAQLAEARAVRPPEAVVARGMVARRLLASLFAASLVAASALAALNAML